MSKMRSLIQICQTVRSHSVQSRRWSNVADMSQPTYVCFLWETFFIWRLSDQSELLLLPSIVQTHKFHIDMRFIMTEICCATLFIVLCPLLSRASHSCGQDVGRTPTGPTVILLLFEIIYDPLIFFFFTYLLIFFIDSNESRVDFLYGLFYNMPENIFYFIPMCRLQLLRQNICQQMSHLCSAWDKTSCKTQVY